MDSARRNSREGKKVIALISRHNTGFLVFLVIFLPLTLSGCVSGRLLVKEDSFYSGKSDAAFITVFRDSAFVAGGSTVAVMLDGKPVAEIGSGESCTFPVRPGTHFVALGMKNELVQRVKARPKQHYFLRTGIDIWGERGPLYFERLTQEQGEAALKSGKYDPVEYFQPSALEDD